MNYLDKFTYRQIAHAFQTPHGHAVELRDYQLDALELMDSGENVSIRFPRQYGGTTLAIIHITKTLLNSPPSTRLAVVGGNHMIARNIVEQVAKLLHAVGMKDIIHRHSRENIELDNGNSLHVVSSINRGHSTQYTAVYWDECDEKQKASGDLYMLERARQIRINCNMRTGSKFTCLHRGVMDFSDIWVDLTRAIEQLGVSAVKREYFGERFTEL